MERYRDDEHLSKIEDGFCGEAGLEMPPVDGIEGAAKNADASHCLTVRGTADDLERGRPFTLRDDVLPHRLEERRKAGACHA